MEPTIEIKKTKYSTCSICSTHQSNPTHHSTFPFNQIFFSFFCIVVVQFQRNTEHALFSNSVVDVFTQLTECYGVVSKLECPDPEILKRYMKRYAKTIVKVLIAYKDIVKEDFDKHLDDERIVSELLSFCFYFFICS